MTFYPANKQLSDYPFVTLNFPFHISVNTITRSFPLHRHDFLECSLITSGTGVEVINGTAYSLRPGTFTFLLPYQVHEIRVTSDSPLTLYNCMFDLEILSGIRRLEPQLESQLWYGEAGPPSLGLDLEQAGHITSILEEIHAEYQQANIWRELCIRLKLTELLLRYKRIRATHVPRAEEPPSSTRTKPAPLWRVLHHIHGHYRDELTLGEVAHAMGYSAAHLSGSFKAYTGQTFLRYVNGLRVRHACSLLRSSDIKVLDAAMEAGFRSFATFSRVFRDFKGMTPNEYRQRGDAANHKAQDS